VTVWETFFLLLTVIPFSKLLLTVFVKMIVPNKPEGNKWGYMMGMSMLVFTVSSALKGIRAIRGSIPNRTGGNPTGSSSGSNPASGSGSGSGKK